MLRDALKIKRSKAPLWIGYAPPVKRRFENQKDSTQSTALDWLRPSC